MSRLSEGGGHANSWNGMTTTVDLSTILPESIADALRRSHNIGSVNRHSHGLTVEVTIDNPAGDADAQQLLGSYLAGPWKSYGTY
jgi:hypothetical protein